MKDTRANYKATVSVLVELDCEVQVNGLSSFEDAIRQAEAMACEDMEVINSVARTKVRNLTCTAHRIVGTWEYKPLNPGSEMKR